MRYAYLGIHLGDVSVRVRRGRARREQAARPTRPRTPCWWPQVTPEQPGGQGRPARGRRHHPASTTRRSRAGRRLGLRLLQADRHDRSRWPTCATASRRPCQVTLGEFPSEPQQLVARARATSRRTRSACTCRTCTPDIAPLPGPARRAREGAIVTEVVPGSRAAKAGLRAEDVILEVNRKPVRARRRRWPPSRPTPAPSSTCASAAAPPPASSPSRAGSAGRAAAYFSVVISPLSATRRR